LAFVETTVCAHIKNHSISYRFQNLFTVLQTGGANSYLIHPFSDELLTSHWAGLFFTKKKKKHTRKM